MTTYVDNIVSLNHILIPQPLMYLKIHKSMRIICRIDYCIHYL